MCSTKVVTRFAPSPTGYLHIGGARTALFNYLFAKKHNGEFVLRIEDTDLERSTPQAVDAIINGLNFLGITPSKPAVFQMQRQNVHINYANQLLQLGNAYKCYCTKQQLEQRREEAIKNGGVYVYDGRCREIKQDLNQPYSIRLKVNKTGVTTITDLVLGEVTVNNNTLDDLILLRSDGVPTYMFAVVVDDHDMNITHVIRGDDHFTNTFRQYQIYKAFGWQAPQFAHLPLIYASDGKKMSKRKNAVAVEDYKAMGFLPKAINNYLMLLGWSFNSNNNNDIISIENAAKIFNVTDVNKSPARFDMAKLENINWHYINQTNNNTLINLMLESINTNTDFAHIKNNLNPNYTQYLQQGLDSIKIRSKTILELINNSLFYLTNFTMQPQATQLITSQLNLLAQQYNILLNVAEQDFTKENLHNIIKQFATENNLKLGEVAKGMRAVLTGQINAAASNFEIMAIYGKQKTLQLLKQHI